MSIIFKLGYFVKKDYENKFNTVVNDINSVNRTEYEYDISKTNEYKKARKEVDEVSKSYMTKKEASDRLSTKELQIGNTFLHKNVMTENILTNDFNTDYLNATHCTSSNLNVNRLNVNKEVNVINRGKIIGNSDNGLNLDNDGNFRIYSNSNISLSVANNDVLNITPDNVTTLNGPLNIRNNGTNAKLTVTSSNGQIAGAFSGTDKWSYIASLDGNTYLRPGSKTGEIFLKDANKINLQSSSVNVKNKLCVGEKCVDEKTFNNPQQINSMKLCLDNYCLTDANVNKYDSMVKDLNEMSKQLKDVETNVTNMQPKDCKLGEWSEWSKCTKDCGGGQQTRTRTILQKPTIGGKLCQHTIEIRNCNTQACPIDCVGSWSDWSSCPSSSGKKTRTFKITTQPNYGGKTCTNKDGEIQTDFCAVDCVGNWTPGTCDPNTGIQTNRYNITTPAAYGGKECPNKTGDTQQKTCPVDCVGSFGNWSACDSRNNKSRTYNVTTRPLNNGAACQFNNGHVETATCKVDCQYTWGNFSGCSTTCGYGTQSRDPIITQQAQGGGAACPGRQTQSCYADSTCPVDCSYGWTGWSECSASCGTGTQKRDPIIYSWPRNGGRACPNTDSRTCNIEACTKDTLSSSDACLVNNCLVSNNKIFKMCQQGDGNLVLYKKGSPIWAHNIFYPNSRLCMQRDGNLVCYSGNTPYWATNVFAGRPPMRAIMQDDGNFVVYNSINQVLWATNTR